MKRPKLYNATQEQMVIDLDTVRRMMTDILLPAKFQAKPNSFVRQRLRECIADNRYDNKIANQLMLNALKQALPAAWLNKTFTDVMEAVQYED